MLAAHFGDQYCSRVCCRIDLNIPEPNYADEVRAARELVRGYGR